MDKRVILSLRDACTLGVLSGRLNLRSDTVSRLVKPYRLAGLVHCWYRGINGPNWCVACLSLTPSGLAYADQLAQELGANEVERLLTPKVGKGKRAPKKPNQASLSDSLGL